MTPPKSEPFPILYRSPRFIVIDKPAGLPVHSDRARRACVEDAFPAWRRSGRDGPWLAHRLDADTAGCLLIGLRKRALVEAQDCFAQRRVRKTYWALVAGCPREISGRIDLPLARLQDRTGWRMGPAPHGAPASTDWTLKASDGSRSWLELTLLTGRTHQARVHCAAIGHPILGDRIYGAPDDEGGLQLLSRALSLQVGQEDIVARALPAPRMARVIANLAPT